MASIQGIYVALFGRPADPAGLAFFNQATNNGADLTAIGDLAGTAEYQDRFTGMSREEVINSIYQTLFGRDGEADGVEFFLNAWNNGTYNINTIAIAILDGAQGDDLANVNAKISAANIFTARMDLEIEIDSYDLSTVQIARDYIDSVNINDPGTEAEADAAIANIVNANQGQEPGGGGGSGNFAPVADPDAYMVNEDGVLAGTSVLANDVDAEGNPLTAVLGQDVANGTLSFNDDGTFTYTPNPDFNGVDSFTYRANDGEFNSNEVTVNITVNPVPETYDLEPGGSLNVAFNSSEDMLTIDNADVSDTWGALGGPNLVSVTATPVAFGFGNATYDLSGAATGSNAVVEFTNDFSSDFSGTINSADLFDALRNDAGFFTGSVNGINVGQNNWEGYLVAYADNNAYVFYGDSGANSTLSSGEVSLVATLTGVSAGSLSQMNFVAGDA